SITSINFKLRKTMHNGLFGVVSAGMGTNGTYQSVVNLNVFNSRNQFAIVGQSNNINKLGDEINTILLNNTFKGKGVKVEYQPDFNLPGANKQSSGGILYTHDFIPDFNQDKQDRLSMNSFINHFSNNTVKQTTILNFIGNNSALTQQINNSLLTDNNEFTVSSRYNKLKNYNSYFVEGDYNYLKQTGQQFLNNKTLVPAIGVASFGNRFDSSASSTNKISFKAGINHQGFFKESKPKLTKWNLSYSLNAENGDTNRTALATFVDSTNTGLNENFNRRYKNNLNIIDQGLSFTLGDFGKMLFKKSRRFSNLNIHFENDLQFRIEKIDNFITDIDSGASEYVKNNFLSTSGIYNELNESPGLRISRDFMHLLANRYQKDWRLELFPKIQFNNQRFSTPNHPLQNINKDFCDFVPNATASYTNFQYGEFVDRYELNFTSSYTLPTTNELFNLADSANLYFIPIGNPHLTPSKNQELSFRFKHNSVSRKNSFYYGTKVSAGITDSYFADSIIITKNGRNIYYNTNLNGHRYLNLNAFFNKALVTGKNQFQFNLKANAFFFRNPGYFEYQQTGYIPASVSHIFMQSDSISLSYTYKDFFAVNFLQYLSFYNSSQAGFTSTRFHNSVSVSNIGVSINPTNKLNFNSNVSFNRTISSGFSRIQSTILNASFAYRFLPGDNLEFKISALDLLNQNKGIINFGNNYSYTRGTVNLLHQYFMATLSFYPRRFGKRKTREK
ncbi:MAG TPA: hypothetical protein VFF57_09675, partial [Hanamia sp.]|nr:hypothetical protein [Hanamia sp.]